MKRNVISRNIICAFVCLAMMVAFCMPVMAMPEGGTGMQETFDNGLASEETVMAEGEVGEYDEIISLLSSRPDLLFVLTDEEPKYLTAEDTADETLIGTLTEESSLIAAGILEQVAANTTLLDSIKNGFVAEGLSEKEITFVSSVSAVLEEMRAGDIAEAGEVDSESEDMTEGTAEGEGEEEIIPETETTEPKEGVDGEKIDETAEAEDNSGETVDTPEIIEGVSEEVESVLEEASEVINDTEEMPSEMVEESLVEGSVQEEQMPQEEAVSIEKGNLKAVALSSPVQTEKLESPKMESAKTESPNIETQKNESSNIETRKNESSNIETRKNESPKTESLNTTVTNDTLLQTTTTNETELKTTVSSVEPAKSLPSVKTAENVDKVAAPIVHELKMPSADTKVKLPGLDIIGGGTTPQSSQDITPEYVPEYYALPVETGEFWKMFPYLFAAALSFLGAILCLKIEVNKRRSIVSDVHAAEMARFRAAFAEIRD